MKMEMLKKIPVDLEMQFDPLTELPFNLQMDFWPKKKK